ncbi:hypothetical protein QQG74_19780 [Micromonospora sp. FIMYZ51]|uniref:hypothetical protein n=1 Tax=Micromonospora sp. FIMYZ51 TaxID=3051832 RepID=UPI00311F5632
MWRWPWRSQRTVQRSTAQDGTPDTASTGEHAADTADDRVAETATGDRSAETASDVAPHRRSEPPAWQALPPIQRITPDEPRLNLPDTFTGTLASWRDPSYLAPLGHLVSGAEPAGVLHGTAEPVATPAQPDPVGQSAAHETAPMPLATPAAPTPQRTASLQRSVLGTAASAPMPAAARPPARPAHTVPAPPPHPARPAR